MKYAEVSKFLSARGCDSIARFSAYAALPAGILVLLLLTKFIATTTTKYIINYNNIHTQKKVAKRISKKPRLIMQRSAVTNGDIQRAWYVMQNKENNR